MFTGLVRDVGIVKSIDDLSGDKRIEIEMSIGVKSVHVGASVCCSGCCLSVVDKSENSLFFDVSNETLSKTTIGSWRIMTRINIEPSLKAGDEMGGHIVSGHVDIVARILSIAEDGGSHRVKIEIPEGCVAYIASKGSIAVDGVSLTINEVEDGTFGVNLIPHTWKNTTLGGLKTGDLVNIEVDMLARYVARIMELGKVG